MYAWVIFVAATSLCVDAGEENYRDYHEEHLGHLEGLVQEVNNDYPQYDTSNYKKVKCYQCSYTPDRVEIEEIRTPKVVRQEVVVPRIVKDTVQVPRVIWEEVTRPRVIKEEYSYFDAPSQEWKVGDRTRHVNDVIWISRQIMETKEITKQVHDVEVITKQVFDVRKVSRKRAGGWDKCLGPFTERNANTWGIDQWDCHSSCYTKVDKNGNVLRGCYKDEFGVDPDKATCQTKYGTKYCFCEGTLCNNGAIPEFKDIDE